MLHMIILINRHYFFMIILIYDIQILINRYYYFDLKYNFLFLNIYTCLNQNY
jgi:hypothetical protein